jgi:lipopolysaccharide biosynthesis protein
LVSPERLPDEGSQQMRPTPRPIAFYLPQFHPIPENDVWWGKGFTEWTNVVQARPLFPGHYQPRLPADLGFYDLRLPEVREAQANLAKEYGIYGFCYFHYWFKGRRILERPFDEVLASGHPDLPFCLCWANHTWTRKWNTQTMGRLIVQEYSEDDDKNHIRWLLGAFQDERYIKIDDRPLFLIYRAQSLPNPLRTITMWKEEAQRMGVAEPYICKVDSLGDFSDPHDLGFDAAVEFPPHRVESQIKRVTGPEEIYQVNQIFDYEERAAIHLERPTPPYRRFPGVIPSWDNTPRFRSGGANIVINSTPELYERWLKGAIEKTLSNPPEEQIVFINAWNEWAESNYLEPDLKYGQAYLEATRRALRASGAEVPTSAVASVASDKANGDMPPTLSIEERYRRLLEEYTRLQQHLMERLHEEEDRILPQELREYYEDLEHRHRKLRGRNQELADNFASLKQRNADLQRRYQELVRRHKHLKQRHEKSGAGQENALEASEMKNRSQHIDRLIQKIQQLRAAISAKLKSRQ